MSWKTCQQSAKKSCKADATQQEVPFPFLLDVFTKFTHTV